jgi:hypothetical protein
MRSECHEHSKRKKKDEQLKQELERAEIKY